MEKRMEKRKRGAANDLEVALSEGDEDREKRIQYSKHQYCGILLSVTILLSFIYFMLSRTDILHIALLHGTNDYHPTHVSEKINGLASASLTQPSIINFNTASTHSDSAGSKFLEVKKDLLDQEPQLHHKIVLPKPVLATAADNSNPFREDHPDSHVESRGLEASLTDLQAEAEKQIMVVRKMKFEQHLVMETDTRAKEQIVILQDKVRKYLHAKYGTGPYYLEMSIHFPDTMMQDGREQKEKIIVELGPVEFIPYCVYYFLQLVETWKGGAFHRNAGHVLQAFVKSQREGLAFQEYSPEFPHKKYTMGYAGRPGGPEFYVSTIDNTRNHGPASQGSKTEADGCFGKIIKGFEVVERMKHQPGGQKGSGFVMGNENYIRIPEVRLLKANEVHLE